MQPIFLRAEGGRIPEMRRVVVAYENRVVMEETLEAGLARIFGGGVGERPTPALAAGGEPAEGAPAAEGAEAPAPVAAAAAAPAAPATGELAGRARQHYERALAAQRAGDWARYGEEIRQLGEVLQRMEAEGAAP